MFVYNISVKLDSNIVESWLTWQKEEHIPQVIATGLFYECKIFKLLDHDEEEESPTYIIQYFTSTKESYYEYAAKYAKGLQVKAFEKWGDSFLAFRTLMQQVQST